MTIIYENKKGKSSIEKEELGERMFKIFNQFVEFCQYSLDEISSGKVEKATKGNFVFYVIDHLKEKPDEDGFITISSPEILKNFVFIMLKKFHDGMEDRIKAKSK